MVNLLMDREAIFLSVHDLAEIKVYKSVLLLLFASIRKIFEVSQELLKELLWFCPNRFIEGDCIVYYYILSFQFADAFNRIECYRDMLLTQTEMLGVQPLMKMAKEFDKMKV